MTPQLPWEQAIAARAIDAIHPLFHYEEKP